MLVYLNCDTSEQTAETDPVSVRVLIQFGQNKASSINFDMSGKLRQTMLVSGQSAKTKHFGLNQM